MELWELENSLKPSLVFRPYKEAKRLLVENGFSVITPFEVRKVFVSVLNNLDDAHEFHTSNMYSPNTDQKYKNVYEKFDKIVLKETRGNTTQWSTLNNYLQYRSGCFYKWYYPNGEVKP